MNWSASHPSKRPPGLFNNILFIIAVAVMFVVFWEVGFGAKFLRGVRLLQYQQATATIEQSGTQKISQIDRRNTPRDAYRWNVR